jgi:hypothetical protein
LFDEKLVIRAANGDELPFEGWIEILIETCQPAGPLRVPFLVTELDMVRPILGYNVIAQIVEVGGKPIVFLAKIIMWWNQ